MAEIGQGGVTGDVMDDERFDHGDGLGRLSPGGVCDLVLFLFRDMRHCSEVLSVRLRHQHVGKLIHFADVVGAHQCTFHEGAQIFGNGRGEWTGRHG